MASGNVINQSFFQIWDLRDKRLDHLPFMRSPVPFLCLLSVYLLIVRYGNKFMEHRKPLKIERLIIQYNIFQIIVNAILCLSIINFILDPKWEYSFYCESSDFSNSPRELYITHSFYFYFITKLFDYFDTVFFILRKKPNHVSFLHVFHHASVSMGVYIVILYQPGGQGIIGVLLNTLVHTVMYSYYLLSILKPETRKNQTIKKNVTRMQMVQFGIMMVHFGHGFITGNECGYPIFFSLLGIAQGVLFFGLFFNFYQHAYESKQKKKLM